MKTVISQPQRITVMNLTLSQNLLMTENRNYKLYVENMALPLNIQKKMKQKHRPELDTDV